MSRDLETSCDERALHTLGLENQSDYGRLLLSFATSRPHAAGPLCFGESHASRRIKSVLKYKKPTAVIVAVALLLVAATIVVAATDPREPDPQPFRQERALKFTSMARAASFGVGNVELLLDQIIYDPLAAAMSRDDPSSYSPYHGSAEIADAYRATIGDTGGWRELTAAEIGTLPTQTSECIFATSASFDGDQFLVYPYQGKTLVCFRVGSGERYYLADSAFQPALADLIFAYREAALAPYFAEDPDMIPVGDQYYHRYVEQLELYADIGDGSILLEFPNLKVLSVEGSLLSSTKNLAGLTGLTSLTLWFTDVSDLTPLQNMAGLSYLNLEVTQVRDVEPLAGLTELRELYLTNSHVADISSLAGLTNLTWLNLEATAVADISAVASMRSLSLLSLAGAPVVDLSPLQALENPVSLTLSANMEGSAAVAALQRHWASPPEIQYYDRQYLERSEIGSW